MCCILGFGVIFSLALPTGKFPLWREGSTIWNTKVIDDPITTHKDTPLCLNQIVYGSHRDNITQVISYKILPLLSSMIPFYNRGRCRRGGTRTWQHILIHHGSVFFVIQSRSGLTSTLDMGGCLSPARLALLWTSITQLSVLNLRLFVMLRSWRGRIDPEWWVIRSSKKRVRLAGDKHPPR